MTLYGMWPKKNTYPKVSRGVNTELKIKTIKLSGNLTLNKIWGVFFSTVTAFEEKTNVLETLKGHIYGPSTEITAISVRLSISSKFIEKKPV